MKKQKNYFKILTEENAGEATIFLYGYIGPQWEYDEDYRLKQTGVTDIDFVRQFNDLQKDYPVIHLRINSPGGEIMHGNAILTALENATSEVHTWNDGVCASMAADIWLMGRRRHMAKNALLMIHPALAFCFGNAQDMRDTSETLDKMSNSVIIATSAATGISEDEIRNRYYSDYKDHWLDYNDAVKDGLLSGEDDDYQSGAVPAGAKKMSIGQLIKHFQKHTPEPERPDAHNDNGGWSFHKLTEAIADALFKKSEQRTPQIDSFTMNIEDFKKTYAEDSAFKAAVDAHLLPAQPPAAPDPQPQTEIAALKTELEAVKTALAALPGASKSAPAMPDTDPATGDGATPAVELDNFNKQMAEGAGKGFNPFRRSGF